MARHIWRFGFVEKKLDIFALFDKNLVTKEGSYISELAQYYRIEKIHKHFCDVLKTGHKGTDTKDFSPAVGEVHLKKKEKEILKRMKIRRNVILNKTNTKKE